MQAGRLYFHLYFEDPPDLLYGIRGNFPLQFGRLVTNYYVHLLCSKYVLVAVTNIHEACTVCRHEIINFSNHIFTLRLQYKLIK